MCTSVIVGKAATEDEIVLLARNEDAVQNNWNKYLVFRRYPEYYNPQGDNPVVQGHVWTLGNGLRVPVPQHQFSYSAMPDAIGGQEAVSAIRDHFFFEERGINERNVAISATNSVDTNDNAQKVDPFVPNSIAEEIIPTLLLPQAETALHAVELLGHYVETYGATQANGILIGDATGTWYFEIGSGRHWIAVRVPDDMYLVVANGMRVHGVDLDSPDVRCSQDLFDFVRKNKLLEDPKRESFNFAEAFGIIGVPYNVNRIWLAQKILTPSLTQATDLTQYPLFLQPGEKVGVAKVMEVLRATYEGTVLEGKATRPIGVDRTAESHIITLNARMPTALQGLIWQVFGTPLGAPYIPLYNAMDVIPSGYSQGSNQYTPSSAYWSFRGLFGLASTNAKNYEPDVHHLWHSYEQQFIQEHPYVSQMLHEMYKSQANVAVKFARNYSTGIASQLIDVANREFSRILTQITSTESSS